MYEVLADPCAHAQQVAHARAHIRGSGPVFEALGYELAQQPQGLQRGLRGEFPVQPVESLDRGLILPRQRELTGRVDV